MIKVSDHIFWTARPSEASEQIRHDLTLSVPSAICFSLLIALLLLYVFLAEKDYSVARQAFDKVISWSGATIIAFATASLAALDAALFVACHHANHLKATFKEKVLHPIITPVINRAIEIYNTTYDHIIESPDAAKTCLRKLLKDEKRLQRAFDLFCITLVATFMVLSLYVQLSFSGLVSQDDLRHVFRTNLLFISSLGCLMYGFYLYRTTLIPGYVLDHLRETAGTYWNRLVMMADPDSTSSSVPQASGDDILLHLEEDMPGSEELLTLYLRNQTGFDFDNQNNLVALFGSLWDDLSLKLPELIDSESVTIVPSECIVIYGGTMGRGCRIRFNVTKGRSAIGHFSLLFVPSMDADLDVTTED
ncbi:hypothetical protein KCU65_g1573, partial [Aureobasidium melanogenum]